MAELEKTSNPNLGKETYHDVETEGGPEVLIDHKAEAKLLRKLDAYIIPITMLLYLLSFLDRVNIGNARLYGLEEDLGLSSDQYQTAVSILFVTYLLSEVPSNLVLKKIRPSRWIAFIATSWGIIATLTGIVQSYAGLIVCRLLLGLVEGGLFPGMAIYLTMFYGKKEIALRIGYLFVAAAIAGAFGGLLAFAIGHLVCSKPWSYLPMLKFAGWGKWPERLEMDFHHRRSSNVRAWNSDMVFPCRQSRNGILSHRKGEGTDETEEEQRNRPNQDSARVSLAR